MVNVIAMWIQSDHTMLVNAINEPSNANFFLIDFSVVGVLRPTGATWATWASSFGRPDDDDDDNDEDGFKRELSTESGMIMKNV